MSRRMRWRWIVFAVSVFPAAAEAAIVKLQDGTVYEGVTIVRHDERVV